MSEHTYMFKDWEWDVKGKVTDTQGNVEEQTGSIKFERSEDLLKIIAEFEITGQNPMEDMVYDVKPFTKGSDFTTWTTIHPHAGKMNGTYWIHGDKIIAHYSDENGVVTGGDFYEKLSDEKYRVTGAVYMNGNPLAKWELVMMKK